jgi:hypothetical protein
LPVPRLSSIPYSPAAPTESGTACVASGPHPPSDGRSRVQRLMPAATPSGGWEQTPRLHSDGTGEIAGSTCKLVIGAGHVKQIGAGGGAVELIHRDVEATPEFLCTSSPVTGAQLVRRIACDCPIPRSGPVVDGARVRPDDGSLSPRQEPGRRRGPPRWRLRADHVSPETH